MFSSLYMEKIQISILFVWNWTCKCCFSNSQNVCHDHICVKSDSQTPKNVCHVHIRVMSDSQTLKYVCHDQIHVMSDKQIPKICSSWTTETLHCRVMLKSQIPQNVCHDHIRVMSDSQMPKKCPSYSYTTEILHFASFRIHIYTCSFYQISIWVSLDPGSGGKNFPCLLCSQYKA